MMMLVGSQIPNIHDAVISEPRRKQSGHIIPCCPPSPIARPYHKQSDAVIFLLLNKSRLSPLHLDSPHVNKKNQDKEIYYETDLDLK